MPAARPGWSRTGITAFAGRGDRDAILRAGLFDAALYGATYLRRSPWRLHPFLHYLLLGEARGYRPNPFFDPRHYRCQLKRQGVAPSGSLLSFYAKQGAGRDEAPSREFEHAWYRWQNPDWDGHPLGHPLGHYLRTGLPQQRDPAPGIDMQRYLESHATDAAGAPALMMQQLAGSGRLSGAGIIHDFGELRARQAAFREALDYRVIRRPGGPKARDLVFLQSGRDVGRRYIAEGRRFDILRNYYEEPGGDICRDSECVLYQPGTKATAVAAILDRDPELLTAYEHVLFLDDDIDLSRGDIERFFGAMREHGLALAQPLLSSDSSCVWPLFKDQRHRGRVVPVSSVEVMMPALSSAALRQVSWTFGESVSGFGIDLLWGHVLAEERSRGAVALVGSVIARHEKAIDDVQGAFYRYMSRSGINPKMELWSIMQRHGVECDFRALEDGARHAGGNG